MDTEEHPSNQKSTCFVNEDLKENQKGRYALLSTVYLHNNHRFTLQTCIPFCHHFVVLLGKSKQLSVLLELTTLHDLAFWLTAFLQKQENQLHFAKTNLFL